MARTVLEDFRLQRRMGWWLRVCSTHLSRCWAASKMSSKTACCTFLSELLNRPCSKISCSSCSAANRTPLCASPEATSACWYLCNSSCCGASSSLLLVLVVSDPLLLSLQPGLCAPLLLCFPIMSVQVTAADDCKTQGQRDAQQAMTEIHGVHGVGLSMLAALEVGIYRGGHTISI